MTKFTYVTDEYVTEFQGQYPQLQLERHHLDAIIYEWRVGDPDALIDFGAIPDECTDFVIQRCDMWANRLNQPVADGEVSAEDLQRFALVGVKKQNLQTALRSCLPLAMHKDHEDYQCRQLKLLVNDGRCFMLATTKRASLVCQIYPEKFSLLHDVEITLSETDCFLLQTWVQKRAPRDSETQLLITNSSLIVRAWWGDIKPRRFPASGVMLPENGFDLIQQAFNSPLVERVPEMVNPKPIKHLDSLVMFADNAVKGVGVPFTAMSGSVFGVCAPVYGDSRSRMDEIKQNKHQFFDYVFHVEDEQ